MFHTTSAALAAERALLDAGVTVTLIPTPRQLSSDCGVAVRFDWERAGTVREIIQRVPLAVAAISPLPG